MISIQATLEAILVFLNHFPLFAIMLRFKDPERLPGGLSFELVEGTATLLHLKNNPIPLAAIFYQYWAIWSSFSKHYSPVYLLGKLFTGRYINAIPRSRLTFSNLNNNNLVPWTSKECVTQACVVQWCLVEFFVVGCWRCYMECRKVESLATYSTVAEIRYPNRLYIGICHHISLLLRPFLPLSVVEAFELLHWYTLPFVLKESPIANNLAGKEVLRSFHDVESCLEPVSQLWRASPLQEDERPPFRNNLGSMDNQYHASCFLLPCS